MRLLFRNYLYGLIPRKVHNRTVLRFFEFLRKLQTLVPLHYAKHEEQNEACFHKHLPVIQQNHGYIEDQHSFSDFLFGASTLHYSGCEIIAVFNTLRSLHGQSPWTLAQLTNRFERDGMVLSGRFGTSPKALLDFFVSHDYSVSFTTEPAEFDTFACHTDSLILTMFNDNRDIRKQVHTIHISKSNNAYTAHNVYGNGTLVGPCDSITSLLSNINGGNAKAICLLGIKVSRKTQRK